MDQTRVSPKNEFCTAWQAWFARNCRRWRPQTAKIYKHIFEKNFRPAFAGRSVNAISPDDAAAVICRENYRVASQRLCRTVLSAFYEDAIERNLALKNPAKRVRTAPLSLVPREPLSVEEATMVLQLAKADSVPWAYAYLKIQLYSGLRAHNIIGLTHEHIVNDKFVIPGEETKTHQPIIMPYHPALGPLFARLPLGASYQAVVRMIRRLRERSGIPRLETHLLRHTFASWLGVRWPESVVAKLLAHSRTSQSMTARYITVSDVQLREALLSLPELP